MADCTLPCVDDPGESNFRSRVLGYIDLQLSGTHSSFFILCETVDQTEVPFVRKVTIDCTGATTVTNWELDFVTPYEVADEDNVGLCT